jgi:hypothetical protein
MIAAAKRLGLYSALLQCVAIFLKSILSPRKAVETIFCSFGDSLMYYYVSGLLVVVEIPVLELRLFPF